MTSTKGYGPTRRPASQPQQWMRVWPAGGDGVKARAVVLGATPLVVFGGPRSPIDLAAPADYPTRERDDTVAAAGQVRCSARRGGNSAGKNARPPIQMAGALRASVGSTEAAGKRLQRSVRSAHLSSPTRERLPSGKCRRLDVAAIRGSALANPVEPSLLSHLRHRQVNAGHRAIGSHRGA
jgi:hypothetical protein